MNNYLINLKKKTRHIAWLYIYFNLKNEGIYLLFFFSMKLNFFFYIILLSVFLNKKIHTEIIKKIIKKNKTFYFAHLFF